MPECVFFVVRYVEQNRASGLPKLLCLCYVTNLYNILCRSMQRAFHKSGRSQIRSLPEIDFFSHILLACTKVQDHYYCQSTAISIKI